MAAGSVGDFIRSVFPSAVSRENDIFEALFANGEGSGTVERIFNELEAERKAWTSESASIYRQRGEQLEKTLSLFSVLKRQPSDTDESVLERLFLLFRRNGDSVWGDRWNVVRLFRAYFATESVWVVNNTGPFSENLLSNGNFENLDGWAFSEGAELSREARFEGTSGVLFNAGGKISQGVSVEGESTYFLHFFLNGAAEVRIEDGGGRSWNPEAGEFGAWSGGENWIPFSSEKWESESLFFLTDSEAGTVRISLRGAEGERTLLDWVRLNRKDGASTFSLVAVFEGKSTEETAVLAPGRDDPIGEADFEGAGYFAPGNADSGAEKSGTSFFDDGTAAVTEDETPTADGGGADVEPIPGYDGMTYNDETKPLSGGNPLGDGKGGVDYEKMSYFEKSFVFGAGGSARDALIQEMLEAVQPSGVTSFAEVLNRESD